MRKGFTLIELLVLIAIIGILGSVVISSMNDAKQKAELAKHPVKEKVQEARTPKMTPPVYVPEDPRIPACLEGINAERQRIITRMNDDMERLDTQVQHQCFNNYN